MNRRSLIVGTLAAGLPASLAAQSATPAGDAPTPADLMSDLIELGLVNGSISRIAPLIGGDTGAQDGMILMFTDLIREIGDEVGTFPVPIDTKMLAGEPDRAIALVDIGSPRAIYVFLYLEADPADGKITGSRYRWSRF